MESRKRGADPGVDPGGGADPPIKRQKMEPVDGPSPSAVDPIERQKLVNLLQTALAPLHHWLRTAQTELNYLRNGGGMHGYLTASGGSATPPPQALASWNLQIEIPDAVLMVPRRVEPPMTPAATASITAVNAAQLSGASDEQNQIQQLEDRATELTAELKRVQQSSGRIMKMGSEPARTKSHWDYLLQEMEWMANDFDRERKWKMQAAKKLAKAVQQWHDKERTREERQRKQEEATRKQLAGKASRMIKHYWANIGKLARFKIDQIQQVEKKRALDEQLEVLVDQAAGLSAKLAGDMGRGMAAQSAMDDDEQEEEEEEEEAPTVRRSSRRSTAASSAASSADQQEMKSVLAEIGARGDDDDFQAVDEEDDETTIDDDDDGDDDEAAMLMADAELDLDELKRRYYTDEPEAEDEAEAASAPPAPTRSQRETAPAAASATPSQPAAAQRAAAQHTEHDRIASAAQIAQSMMPTGFTLQTSIVRLP